MPIPENIIKQNILKAIRQIDGYGVPQPRRAMRYFLRYNDKQYPVKYVISLANWHANGENLNPNPKVFNTYQAVEYLQAFGFEIIGTWEK